MKEPAFLSTLRTSIGCGVWFDSNELARRLNPQAAGKELVRLSKDMSRRLSNINRNGHIARREAAAGAARFQYQLMSARREDRVIVNSVFSLARLQPGYALA